MEHLCLLYTSQLPIAKQAFPPERAIAGNPRLASPTQQPADRAAFFAAYALEPFDQVRKTFCTLPPLPVRPAAKLLSPCLLYTSLWRQPGGSFPPGPLPGGL